MDKPLAYGGRRRPVVLVHVFLQHAVYLAVFGMLVPVAQSARILQERDPSRCDVHSPNACKVASSSVVSLVHQAQPASIQDCALGLLLVLHVGGREVVM